MPELSDGADDGAERRTEHEADPARASAPEKKSFNQRLRDRYFGKPRPDSTPADEAAADSVLTKSNQMGFFGRVARPGGFDRPPEEPVELEGPLPWELSDDDSDGDDVDAAAR